MTLSNLSGLLDHEPTTDSFLHEVVEGLSSEPPQLPCKLLYDEEGARLYDEITRLDEYYLTRTETGILQTNINEIVRLLGPRPLVVEYGSGSSEKTRILLDHLRDASGYVPIDISREQLLVSADALAADYPHLRIMPVCADYSEPFALPEVASRCTNKVVFFPGSTLGNFHPPEAIRFMERMGRVCGPGGAVLIGVDIDKDSRVLEAAYDDLLGVTARFNLNILTHLNRDLNANFDVSGFAHQAVYNRSAHRIEIYLVCRNRQLVEIGEARFSFEPGDRIWTESSYKYPQDIFADMVDQAGLRVVHRWTDPDDLFSVQLLRPRI